MIKIKARSKQRSIRLKKKKSPAATCADLKIMFSKEKEPRQITNPHYSALLRCMSKENRDALTARPNLTDYW